MMGTLSRLVCFAHELAFLQQHLLQMWESIVVTIYFDKTIRLLTDNSVQVCASWEIFPESVCVTSVDFKHLSTMPMVISAIHFM